MKEISNRQRQVLNALRRGKKTDKHICRYVLGIDLSTIVSTRNRLVELGRVRDSGKKRLNHETGRMNTVWELVK